MVSSAYAAGLSTTPNGTIQFLSPTVTVTYAATQKIVILSTVSLGTLTAGGANGLNIYPCYKLTTATSPRFPTLNMMPWCARTASSRPHSPSSSAPIRPQSA